MTRLDYYVYFQLGFVLVCMIVAALAPLGDYDVAWLAGFLGLGNAIWWSLLLRRRLSSGQHFDTLKPDTPTSQWCSYTLCDDVVDLFGVCGPPRDNS